MAAGACARAAVAAAGELVRAGEDVTVVDRPAGTFRQRTELTSAQHLVLGKPGIDPPKKIIELGLPATS